MRKDIKTQNQNKLDDMSLKELRRLDTETKKAIRSIREQTDNKAQREIRGEKWYRGARKKREILIEYRQDIAEAIWRKKDRVQKNFNRLVEEAFGYEVSQNIWAEARDQANNGE
jgi:RecA-family ATPase